LSSFVSSSSSSPGFEIRGVELVHADVVDVSPLAAEREKAGVEEVRGEIRDGGGDESGDGGGERGLVEGLVGVSETEEETLPDLEESGGGEREGHGDGHDAGVRLGIRVCTLQTY
jgi:hypothetical protein